MSKKEIKQLKELINELNKINKGLSEELTWTNNQYDFFEKSLISANEKLKKCEKKLKNEKIDRKDRTTKQRLKQAATIIKLKGEKEYYKDMTYDLLKQEKKDLKKERQRLMTINALQNPKSVLQKNTSNKIPDYNELLMKFKNIKGEENEEGERKKKSKQNKNKSKRRQIHKSKTHKSKKIQKNKKKTIKNKKGKSKK